MAAFEYVALDADGRRSKGVLSAESARQARRELARRKLTPIKIAEARTVGARGENRGLSRSEVVPVTRQLAALINAAMPVEEALNAVAMQTDRPGARAALLKLRGRVTEGWRLSDALAEQPRSFPELYVAVVAAGEASGELGRVLLRLADMLEKDRAVRSKALTSLIYPAALALVALSVVIALLVFIVPRVVAQFDAMGAELPWITRALIGLSEWIVAWGWLVALLLAVAGVAGWRALRAPGPRLAFDGFLLRVPLVGGLLRSLDAARFARTLSTLFASGTPLLDSLRAATRTVLNRRLRASLDGVSAAVREGAALSAALRKSKAFPPLMSYMIAAGERSGELPAMLDNVATQLETEFDQATTTTLKLLEPAIIIFMGVVVTGVVFAILMPILELNSLAAF